MRQLPIWCMLKCARLYGSYSANTSSDLPLSAYVLLHSCMHDRLCSRLQGAQTEFCDSAPMTSLPLLLCQESLPAWCNLVINRALVVTAGEKAV